MKKLIALIIVVLVVINSGVSMGESVVNAHNTKLVKALEV